MGAVWFVAGLVAAFLYTALLDGVVVKQDIANDSAFQAKVHAAVNMAVHNLGYMKNMRPKGETYPEVASLPAHERKRILVTGGAGFVGSHLTDRLMEQGHEVIVIDNHYTGHARNLAHWNGHPNFQLMTHDVVFPLTLEVDEIYHLACPASPQHYMANPVKTLKTSIFGTHNMLGLAKRTGARMLLASTSEVYGDPLVPYQNEEYWGNVNPFGPRSCYDEGKRVAESLCYSYAERDGVDVRIARIFNTYGPRMNIRDGRVVSNFIVQALLNESITVYGDGEQTRSFMYIDDLVAGLMALMESAYVEPVNIGNPDERSVNTLATNILEMTRSSSVVTHLPPVRDDPQLRKPDITLARKVTTWEPKVLFADGIQKTIEYFRKEMGLPPI